MSGSVATSCEAAAETPAVATDCLEKADVNSPTNDSRFIQTTSTQLLALAHVRECEQEEGDGQGNENKVGHQG
jgi:hypothetical protein